MSFIDFCCVDLFAKFKCFLTLQHFLYHTPYCLKYTSDFRQNPCRKEIYVNSKKFSFLNFRTFEITFKSQKNDIPSIYVYYSENLRRM